MSALSHSRENFEQMKAKQIGILLVALAATGLWLGRLAWRIHHNMVTLHARNMPLAEVVRSLERQTWEKVRFDKSMNARITLNVEEVPLEQVLDLVADRAGGRWQKTFAVSASDGAIKKLESALESAGKLGPAGWTNIAPQFNETGDAEFPGGGPEPAAGTPGPFFHRTF